MTDIVQPGLPPENLEGSGGAFGAKAIQRDPNGCVRIMLKGFRVTSGSDGTPIAYVELASARAVQAVQALRQTIDDARGGRFR